MRLINCSTLQLEEFFGTNIPRYAVLSHTWGNDEVSFADLTSGQPLVGSGYQKIIFTCQQAIKDEIGYAWVDTCCIDKSSSAELSEAINSMFAWYQNSVRCYAYLSDVRAAKMDKDLPKSRWFRRGWTLQEMLAPRTVTFYDQQWVNMGDLHQHAGRISKITGIDQPLLWTDWSYVVNDKKFDSYCVATRMSWASTRQTTRAEDMAYCLLGIFNINMPLLYGEGDRAFRRLQEEIIRKSDDDSILAWSLSPRIDHPGPPGLLRRSMRDYLCRTSGFDCLARSPEDFTNCADLTRATIPPTPFTLTNSGLQIQLPVVRVLSCGACFGDAESMWIGLLGCSRASSRNFLGIKLYPDGDEDSSSVRVVRLRQSCSTVDVGPRYAFSAVSKTVTIAGFNGFQRGRNFDYACVKQVIVNECKAIRRLGYQLKAFSAWGKFIGSREPLLAYHPLWDPGSKILTIRENDPFDSLFEFSFEKSPSDRNPNFTVFINRSGRGTVREGDAFSEKERLTLFRLLKDDGCPPYDKDRVYDKGEALVHDNEERLFHISVEVDTKAIGRHWMVRVNVDASGDGFSDDADPWTCNCEKHVYLP